jgi:hypothetical protein
LNRYFGGIIRITITWIDKQIILVTGGIMDYIQKKIAPWEIKYGQIMFSGENNLKARDIFKEFFGKSFILETYKGHFDEIHFNEKSSDLWVRLSCSQFFKNLSQSEQFYIYVKDDKTITISKTEPNDKKNQSQNLQKKFTELELLELIAKLTNENQQLRETNSVLFPYKERIDKYENLQKIFNDEKFMEDWLVRNIHKAIADLDVIDRQPTITWPDLKTNRMDLLCLDRTTKELVIVENKVKGNKKTIDTQYLKYRAWAGENLDKINEKYKNQKLKATENFKFVIITDTIDDSFESMCRYEKIPLILIDGGVIFEEIVPYNN